jgi:hypothetical protein
VLWSKCQLTSFKTTDHSGLVVGGWWLAELSTFVPWLVTRGRSELPAVNTSGVFGVFTTSKAVLESLSFMVLLHSGDCNFAI